MIYTEAKHHLRTSSDQRAVERYKERKDNHICPRYRNLAPPGYIVCDSCKYKQKSNYINRKKR